MAYEVIAEIKYYFAIILSPLSVFTNGLLFWLITYKSSKLSFSYKKVLYLGCIVDFFHSLWFFLVEPEVITVKGVAFLFTKGVLGYLPFPWTAWTYNLTLFFVYFCLVNALIQFVYRYLLVCWNIQLNKWMFGLLILLGASIVMLYPGCFMVHLWNRTLQDSYYSFLLNGTEFEIDGKVPPYGAFPLYEFPYLLHIVIGITFLSYCALVFCGICVWRKLKKDASKMSSEAKNFQKQISIVLTVEALIPVFTAVFPIALNIFMILTEISFAWEGKVTFLLLSLPPIINPISKITVITSYRRWVLEQLHFPQNLSWLNGGNNSVTII